MGRTPGRTALTMSEPYSMKRLGNLHNRVNPYAPTNWIPHLDQIDVLRHISTLYISDQIPSHLKGLQGVLPPQVRRKSQVPMIQWLFGIDATHDRGIVLSGSEGRKPVGQK